MAKVFIYPATSLILSDLVARFGHKPLGAALGIRERIQTGGVDSPPPPLQITPEEPKRGLKYAAVEVPSGVRGRMAIYGPPSSRRPRPRSSSPRPTLRSGAWAAPVPTS